MIQISFKPLSTFKFGYALMLACLLLILSACATYPTQELSDARQAIRAAEEVGANNHLPKIYNNATELLSNAESDLNAPSPNYSDAKSKALAAKNEAVKARHLTVSLIEAKKTIAQFETVSNHLPEAKQALEKAFNAIRNESFDEALKFSELAKNLAIQGR